MNYFLVCYNVVTPRFGIRTTILIAPERFLAAKQDVQVVVEVVVQPTARALFLSTIAHPEVHVLGHQASG